MPWLACAALLLFGCPAPPAAVTPPPPPPPPDVVVRALTDLLPSVGLEWAILLRPKALWSEPWLRPSIQRVLRDDRMTALAETTGVDLRESPEAVLASYRQRGHAPALAYFVRHRHDTLAAERKFRERLTSKAKRTVAGHQLVGMWGMIGTGVRGFAGVGRDVVGYQYGGSVKRGPARIALLYAQGKLAKVATLLAEPTLAPLHARLRQAAVLALMPGPFEDDLARGARGLLAAATAVAVALTPTPHHTLRLEVVLAGDYRADAGRARELMALAWQDLTRSDLGHLLGLHAAKAPTAFEVHPEALLLATELDAAALFDGLAAATSDSVRDIMKAPQEEPAVEKE